MEKERKFKYIPRAKYNYKRNNLLNARVYGHYIFMMLDLSCHESLYDQNTDGGKDYRSLILRMSKSLKFVKSITIGNCGHRTPQYDKFIITRLAKKCRRIAKLKHLDVLPEEKSSLYLSLWLKNACHIKTLCYNISNYCFSISLYEVYSYDKEIKEIFIWLRKLRLGSLTLDLRINVPRLFFILKHYPITLKKLIINFPGRYTPRRCFIEVNEDTLSLKPFKNLETFCADLPKIVPTLSVRLTECILGYSSLLNLNLRIDENIFPEVAHLFSLLKNFMNLQRFRITMPSLCSEGENLLESIKHCHLVEFGLACWICVEDELVRITELLCSFPCLQSLNLHIKKKNTLYRNKQLIMDLFKQISRIVFLEDLDLRLLLSGQLRLSENDLLFGVIDDLKNLFMKPVHLKSFSFFFTQLNPEERFLTLFQQMKNILPHLIVLRIDLADYVLDDSDKKLVKTIFKYLESLKQADILYLSSFYITKRLFMKLRKSLRKLRNLKHLETGNFKGTVLRHISTTGKEKITLIKALNDLYKGSWEFEPL